MPITESFDYNGTDNLIVDIEVLTNSGVETSWKYDPAVTDRRLIGPVGNITGAVQAGVYDTVFRFNGAPVSVITDGLNATGNVFPENNGNGRLSLYRASELGTTGTIDSVACRIDGASTATSYVNYQVNIGHSNVDSLSITAAANFASQTVAVNGTVTVAGRLLQGDWIEVP